MVLTLSRKFGLLFLVGEKVSPAERVGKMPEYLKQDLIRAGLGLLFEDKIKQAMKAARLGNVWSAKNYLTDANNVMEVWDQA